MAPQAAHTEIVPRAQAAELAGATVLRGIESYGASEHVHTTRVVSLSEDLPVAVIIIDDAEHISAFFPHLDELISEGLAIIDAVEGDRLPRPRRRGAAVMSTLLWVALGSALGAPPHYLLDQFIQHRYERVFPRALSPSTSPGPSCSAC